MGSKFGALSLSRFETDRERRALLRCDGCCFLLPFTTHASSAADKKSDHVSDVLTDDHTGGLSALKSVDRGWSERNTLQLPFMGSTREGDRNGICCS